MTTRVPPGTPKRAQEVLQIADDNPEVRASALPMLIHT